MKFYSFLFKLSHTCQGILICDLIITLPIILHLTNNLPLLECSLKIVSNFVRGFIIKNKIKDFLVYLV